MKTPFLLFLVLILSFSAIAQTNLELRINPGGPEVTYAGNVFLADQYYTNGNVTSNDGIGLTPPFNTIRYAINYEMEYNFPVLNGDYQLTLYFAETYFGAPNKDPSGGVGDRIFDVTIEGVKLIDDFDVYQAAGGAGIVIQRSFTVSVTDGTLNLYFSSLAADGGERHAIVNAIEVLGIAPDTQAPTAPALSATGQTDTTADLNWSGATDDNAVTGYKVFKDGTLKATLGNVSTYQVTGLTEQTTYEFTVKALDAAGNESIDSNVVSVTTDATSGGGSSTGVWNESGTDINYTAGNVGIGTSIIPTGYTLAVSGKIISEELKVQLQSQWPDYVFMENYRLPGLEEVERYIRENGHLKNIPSEQDVKANGIEVGEMNRLLLEKIEEQMLYILQLHKQQLRMQEEISILKNRSDNACEDALKNQ